MEKGKRIEVVNGEILLPGAIIQHIQSFLSGKQAAQTSILSKSWYSAWSTRPNLDFDQRDFRKRGDGGSKSQITDGFPKFVKKNMQRYQELNLKIESFRLWMKHSQWDSDSLANELIVKAMKMGTSDLNFEFNFDFILPREVLGAETLIRLSMTGWCKIDRGVDVKVSCSRLKSLSLRKVDIGGDIIRDIISSCPLIEEFLLSECKCLYKVQSVNFVRRTRMFALSPFFDMRKQKFFEMRKQNVGSVVDWLINLYELRKLKCLLLEKVKIGGSFFNDFSSKFPCLKDLTLRHCVGYNSIRISSHSLECISFAQERMLRADFDVPSIRKFKFLGSGLPSVSFETASREWESDISIACLLKHPSTIWFLRLNKFLRNLSLSKISLSFNIRCRLEKGFDYARAIQGLPKPAVEHLAMRAPSSVYNALLDGFFWSCRPKFITQFITQYWFPKSYMIWEAKNDFQEILCKRLIQQLSQNCCIPNQSMYGQSDLEEVNVEFFEESLAEWRPLPWKMLLDASTSPAKERKIRFQLKWGLEPNTFK